MKLIGISDIHGYLMPYEKLTKDYFDVLCICGDIVPLKIQFHMGKSESWFKEDFYNWCENAPCEKVIFIAGNHDFYLQTMLDSLGNAKEVTKHLGYTKKIIFLHDTTYEFKNKLFYGTPWIPKLSRWAFYKNSKDLSETFENITDCDVLLTHSPGKRVFDTGRILQYGYGEDVGSEELTNVVLNRHIKLWLCGHIHSGNHVLSEFTDPKFTCYKMKVANVSIKDEQYQPIYSPLYIEL